MFDKFLVLANVRPSTKAKTKKLMHQKINFLINFSSLITTKCIILWFQCHELLMQMMERHSFTHHVHIHAPYLLQSLWWVSLFGFMNKIFHFIFQIFEAVKRAKAISKQSFYSCTISCNFSCSQGKFCICFESVPSVSPSLWPSDVDRPLDAVSLQALPSVQQIWFWKRNTLGALWAGRCSLQTNTNFLGCG